MEQQLKGLQKQLRDLRAQRDTLTTASVKDRLRAVERALTGSADVVEINRTLRDAIARIVLDPVAGHIVGAGGITPMRHRASPASHDTSNGRRCERRGSR